jgi:hypothetical protein
MGRRAEAGDADSLAAQIGNRFDLGTRPSVDGEHRQRTGNRDQIASRQPARDNRATSRVTDWKFTGENRRIDQWRAAHEAGSNSEAVFLE